MMPFVLKHWREIKRVRGIEKGYYHLIVTFTFLIKEIERILVNNGDMVVAKYIQFQLVHDVLNS